MRSSSQGTGFARWSASSGLHCEELAFEYRPEAILELFGRIGVPSINAGRPK